MIDPKINFYLTIRYWVLFILICGFSIYSLKVENFNFFSSFVWKKLIVCKLFNESYFINEEDPHPQQQATVPKQYMRWRWRRDEHAN